MMVFTCSNRACKCLNVNPGLYFFTHDIREAEKHSRENNSPMWIGEMSDEDYESQKRTLLYYERIAS